MAFRSRHSHHEKLEAPSRNRSQHSRQARIGEWIGSLGWRLSLPPAGILRQRAKSASHWPADNDEARHHPTGAAERTATAEAEGREGTQTMELSHSDRHEINLVYHLLRDHRDALQLCGACQLDDEECGLGSTASSTSGDCDTAAGDNGSDCSSRQGDDAAVCYLKKCDSESCLSTCSGCSKRFKHKRRTARWNQEYDREYKEKQGLIDRNYLRVCQIK